MSSLRLSLSNVFQEIFLPTQGGFNPGPVPANSTELHIWQFSQPCRVSVREKIKPRSKRAVEEGAASW